MEENKMIDKYTAQAKTQEEAIEKGLQELGITRSEAEIEVNSPGKKGFLGFGAKDAVVTVKRKGNSEVDALIDQAVPSQTKFENSTELETDKFETEKKSVQTEDLNEVDNQPKTEVEEIEDDDSQTLPNQLEKEKAQEENQSDSHEDTIESGSADGDNAQSQDNPSENPDDQEAIEYVHEYLVDIIAHMGIDDAAVTAQQDGRFVQYDIETKDAGLVIGRHGKVLNGLQTLAQIQLHQRADNKLNARVDAENYRNRRKDTVEHLAEKTARQVIDTNQQVILEPMPAHERKQIHRYLSRYDNIQTHSEGKEPHRYLVVEPKNI